MSRRAARETALKVLFQVDVGKVRATVALDHMLAETVAVARSESFTRQLVEGTLAHLAEVDALITRYAVDWTLDRMGNIDRNLLRLAIFEMMHVPDVPPSVAVNEAVELAKKYGDADSAKFVNGILGNVVRGLAKV